MDRAYVPGANLARGAEADNGGGGGGVRRRAALSILTVNPQHVLVTGPRGRAP